MYRILEGVRLRGLSSNLLRRIPNAQGLDGTQSMKWYRKKPVKIEAVRFDDKGLNEIELMAKNDNRLRLGFANRIGPHCIEGSLALFVTTLEGEMLCQPLNWLIRGTAGELYVCDDTIFESIYEPA